MLDSEQHAGPDFTDLVNESLETEMKLAELLNRCPEELLLEFKSFASQLKKLHKDESVSYESVRSAKKQALHLLERLADVERAGKDRQGHHRVIDQATIGLAKIAIKQECTAQRHDTAERGNLSQLGLGTFEEVDDVQTGKGVERHVVEEVWPEGSLKEILIARK